MMPEGYMMLQALSTGFSIFDRVSTYNDQTSAVYAKYDTAQKQAALQNQSTYNGFLHLGEVQQLNAKKHAIGLTELYKIARRTRASEKVLISEQAGSASQTGAKRLQVLNAEALDAARRKNENFETLVKDFEYKKRNLTLENISANNRTFSGLSTLPSKTGLITGLAGDLINANLSIGYGTDRDGKIYNRFIES